MADDEAGNKEMADDEAATDMTNPAGDGQVQIKPKRKGYFYIRNKVGVFDYKMSIDM